jgi:heme-degrading monooxygenase HmoA
MLLRILKNTSLEYIKYNRVRFKEGSKKVTEIFTDFFETTKRTVKGLKRYAILENIENERETIVLTFWRLEKIWKSIIQKTTRFYLI